MLAILDTPVQLIIVMMIIVIVFGQERMKWVGIQLARMLEDIRRFRP